MKESGGAGVGTLETMVRSFPEAFTAGRGMSESESLTRKASAGLLWNQMSRFGEYGVMFVLSIVLARGLGTEGFGRYTVVISFSYICILLSTLGLNEAMNNFVPKYQDTPGTLSFILRRALGARIAGLVLICGAVALLSPQLAERRNRLWLVRAPRWSCHHLRLRYSVRL